MNVGKIEYIHWRKFLAPNFQPHEVGVDGWTTCGTPILSMVTGIKPQTIERYCAKPNHGWTTLGARRYLAKKGYLTIPVTKNSVTNVGFWQSLPLTPQHVLLINATVTIHEASWFLLYDNKLWHNEYLEPGFNSLFFLNKPTQDVCLVWHPRWAGTPNSSVHNTLKTAR